MKRGWMAISVTTVEALKACLNEECPVISIEQPLYDSFRSQLTTLPAVLDYEITWYDTLEIAIAKKIRGTNRFDDAQFYIYHYFLRER